MIKAKSRDLSLAEYEDSDLTQFLALGDPRLRTVRRRNRRKHKHRLTVPLILVMTILLAIITSASISAFEWLQAFYLSHTYSIKGITVKGNRRISSADILSASNLRVGTDSVHSMEAYIVEKRIGARFRYLESVKVQHTMDGWVTIAVKEREPVALVADPRNVDSFMVIDAHGFILEKGVESPHFSFAEYEEIGFGAKTRGSMPVIVGVAPEPATSGRRQESLKSEASNLESQVSSLKSDMSSPVLDLALDVLNIARSVAPELLGEISRLDARDPDNIILILNTRSRAVEHEDLIPTREGKAVPHARRSEIRIASDRIGEGLSNILPVIMKRREENRETKYIDARFPGAIYCGNGVGSDHYEGGW